jgi:aminoacrylate hydrolase
MLGRMQACLDHERRATMPHIVAPTLVLGMADDVSTPAYGSQEIAEAIPGARLVLLPYGGHNAPQVVPDDLLSHLLGFLSSPVAVLALRD